MRNLLLILPLILAGCSYEVVEAPLGDPYYCAVMCESTREKYSDTKYSEIRKKTEDFCYDQCKAEYLDKKCD